MNRNLIAATILALVVGFGGGLITAKVLGSHAPSTLQPVSTDGGLWSLFGKPRPTPTPEGEYTDDYGDDSPDDEGRVVWKGFVAVKGDPGARTTTVFPLGAVLKSMAPGGYVIMARDASGARAIPNKDNESDNSNDQPAQARRWVIFTDMALTAFSGSRSLDVVVRSLKTARTLAGLPVALVAKDGETMATVRAGANGLASFPHALLQGEGASTPKMVMAYGAAGDLAVLDLDRSPIDLSKQAGGGHDQTGASGDLIAGRTAKTAIDGYLYADRGIYRPGEKAHLTAPVRDDQSKAVNDRKGYIEVLRPSGNSREYVDNAIPIAESAHAPPL